MRSRRRQAAPAIAISSERFRCQFRAVFFINYDIRRIGSLFRFRGRCLTGPTEAAAQRSQLTGLTTNSSCPRAEGPDSYSRPDSFSRAAIHVRVRPSVLVLRTLVIVVRYFFNGLIFETFVVFVRKLFIRLDRFFSWQLRLSTEQSAWWEQACITWSSPGRYWRSCSVVRSSIGYSGNRRCTWSI